MAVTQGAAAPDFSLQTTRGELALKKLRGSKVVLYFYPKDDTPGCTQEACDFRDSLRRLEGHGAVVLGVSKDSLAAHERFKAKYQLPFALASDPDNAVAKAYGAFGKKMMYGKPVVGTIRSTFLIDERGKVERAWSPVKVKGHVDAVLAALNGEAPAESRPAARSVAVKPRATKPAAAKPAKKARSKAPKTRTQR